MFIPRRTIECDELLEENGLLNDKVNVFALDLIYFEDDLLSMEIPNSFANHLLDDDDTYKILVKKSIFRVETVFGKIKYKFAKGSVSCQILNKVNEYNASLSLN